MDESISNHHHPNASMDYHSSLMLGTHSNIFTTNDLPVDDHRDYNVSLPIVDNIIGNDDDDEVNDEDGDDNNDISTRLVLSRMERVVASIIAALDAMTVPEMVQYHHPIVEPVTSDTEQPLNVMKKRFSIQQSRSFTSMLLVIAYCHALLQSTDDYGRTRSTTTREVYYYYVTHFRSQRECDTAIWDVCTLLQVPRHSLGLQASSRGWFCGDVQLLDIHDGKPQWNGHSYRGEQGCPISSDWVLPSKKRSFRLDPATTATSIVVVEKEGIYQRLVQDGFCYTHQCILVTGKGFPDLATRACVYTLHRQLHLPVFGLADCDPFGVAVLNCYFGGTMETTTTLSNGRGSSDRYAVPIQWLGLRPSQVQYLSQPTTFYNVSYPSLPSAVFQQLTDIDRKRLMDHFWNEQHPFILDQHPARLQETHEMISMKVELEALYWLGMDFCSRFVGFLLETNQHQRRFFRRHQQSVDLNHEITETDDFDWSWMDII
jgi:meiotic recombination protein SPO11